jgi:hypothetical protein
MYNSLPSEEFQQPHSYHDESGQLAFVVLRLVIIDAQGKHTKTFYLRPSGEPNIWIYGLNAGLFMRSAPGQYWRSFDAAKFECYPPVTRQQQVFAAAPAVLYRQAELLQAVAAKQTVYLARDEEQAEHCRSLGVAATCYPENNWRAEYNSYFKGAHVVLLDTSAKLVAEFLASVTRRLRFGSAEEVARFNPPTLGIQRAQPAREPLPSGDGKVIELATRAQEIIEITELEPYYRQFPGKSINPDGSITPYPDVRRWRQSVACVPATVPHLFVYLREARKRNICLIRGAPANPDRQPTRRQKAGVHGKEDRGDHGFLDEPTELFFVDVDGAPISWLADPEQAIRTLLGWLGEPWASTSCVWFFTTKHGLEFDEQKRWTGKIVDGNLRVRLGFITTRALVEQEAKELTRIAGARGIKVDVAICGVVQPNYIARPHWVGHPNCNALGDIPTIGQIRGTHDRLAVPDDLSHKARWAQAQGHGSEIADHPNAESAVRGVGSDGRLRAHLLSAVVHLLKANPIPEVLSFIDHSLNIADKLRSMVARHREEISSNLIAHRRSWSEVENYLAGMSDWAFWCLNHPGSLRRKTIKFSKQEPKDDAPARREEIFARVVRTIARAYPEIAAVTSEPPPVTLLVAPPGGGKSTQIRKHAVAYVTEHPDRTVVILMPRHRLGDEQIEMLKQEHPDGKYSAAVWRGRHALDPYAGDERTRMCRRDKEAEGVEMKILDVESSLCKRGLGKKEIKCPLYDTCAYQQQKGVKANIWFAAHECAVHEMPKVFGNVGWVIFDESPLDAFIFGIDINRQVKLPLDELRTPLPIDEDKPNWQYGSLMKAREELYRALDKFQAAAVPRESLRPFVTTLLRGFKYPEFDAWGRRTELPNYCYYYVDMQGNTVQLPPGHAVDMQGNIVELTNSEGPDEQGNIIQHPKYHPIDMRNLTWRAKVDPGIRPNMPWEQVKDKLEEAAINPQVKTEVTLWELIAAGAGNTICGRIAIEPGKDGRVVRMIGVRPLANGWDAPTLICDATGDAELLKPIWPQLKEPDPHGWKQLARPASVRLFQCVDRALSKWAVAVDGKRSNADGARRLYAAVLMKALEYGGADVGVIVYKSTADWIRKNCFVPDWLTLEHWGDITGTNALKEVRALFVIGRPLAPPEAVTQQAEALFGEHIPQREYVVRQKGGRIPIVPTPDGNKGIEVDVWEHPHPMAERLRRQITEGAIIQAVGRARAGLRPADAPLDLHLWTDVPVPELGPVEPVLWNELEAPLDWLMLATAGVWLNNIADAARAFKGLFTADALEKARERARAGGRPITGDGGGGVPTLLIRYIISNVGSPRFCHNSPAWRQTDHGGWWGRSPDIANKIYY